MGVAECLLKVSCKLHYTWRNAWVDCLANERFPTTTGLDYCYNWNGCVTDSDCPPVPCNEEPCDQHVCRNNECVIVASCGQNLCGVGEYCCNESCGVCAPMGGGCTQQFCDTQCGPAVCQAGDICCNESCGICTLPRDSCTEEICEDDDMRRRVLKDYTKQHQTGSSQIRKQLRTTTVLFDQARVTNVP